MKDQPSAPNQEERARIERAIEKHRDAIAAVDWDLINDEVGVLQAESELRAALDKVLERLEAKDDQAVSQLGYREVASGFIFLQRVMGGIQINGLQRSSTISDIAAEAGLTYEQVQPLAEAAFAEARKLTGKKDSDSA